MALENRSDKNSKKVPPQRKTTLKWGNNGELSSIDMARILDRLQNPNLTECEITSKLNNEK